MRAKSTVETKDKKAPGKKVDAPRNPEHEDVENPVHESMEVVAPPNCLVNYVTKVEKRKGDQQQETEVQLLGRLLGRPAHFWG